MSPFMIWNIVDWEIGIRKDGHKFCWYFEVLSIFHMNKRRLASKNQYNIYSKCLMSDHLKKDRLQTIVWTLLGWAFELKFLTQLKLCCIFALNVEYNSQLRFMVMLPNVHNSFDSIRIDISSSHCFAFIARIFHPETASPVSFHFVSTILHWFWIFCEFESIML